MPKVPIMGVDGAPQATNGLAAVVVDDNPVVLEFTTAIVEALGYQVYMASDGI